MKSHVTNSNSKCSIQVHTLTKIS